MNMWESAAEMPDNEPEFDLDKMASDIRALAEKPRIEAFHIHIVDRFKMESLREWTLGTESVFGMTPYFIDDSVRPGTCKIYWSNGEKTSCMFGPQPR
jgi:hypothetical protein